MRLNYEGSGSDTDTVDVIKQYIYISLDRSDYS